LLGRNRKKRRSRTFHRALSPENSLPGRRNLPETLKFEDQENEFKGNFQKNEFHKSMRREKRFGGRKKRRP